MWNFKDMDRSTLAATMISCLIHVRLKPAVYKSNYFYFILFFRKLVSLQPFMHKTTGPPADGSQSVFFL